MKTTAIFTFSLALSLISLAATAQAKPVPDIRPVVSTSSALQVDVWTDKGEGAIYREGDPIQVYFRANSDSYVTIYDITTDGHTRILFPRYPDDGFLYGGITYRLPDYYDASNLYVDGPRGVEYIHAVATRRPNAFRFGVRFEAYFLDGDPVSEDPFLAINRINGRLISPSYIHATATTSFFVGSFVWYPRYLCRSCHAGTYTRFDPYADSCPRYEVYAAHDYDYWWYYDYHPRHTRFVFAGPFWRLEFRRGPVVRRYAHYSYLECAWGHGNYHPRHFPSRPHTVVKVRHTRAPQYRDYQRTYSPVTYETTSRSRGYGARTAQDRTLDRGTDRTTRSSERTRVAPGTVDTRDRSTANTGTRQEPTTGRERNTTSGQSIDTRDRSTTNTGTRQEPTTGRERNTTSGQSIDARDRSSTNTGIRQEPTTGRERSTTSGRSIDARERSSTNTGTRQDPTTDRERSTGSDQSVNARDRRSETVQIQSPAPVQQHATQQPGAAPQARQSGNERVRQNDPPRQSASASPAPARQERSREASTDRRATDENASSRGRAR